MARFLKVIAALTLAIGILPFVPYGVARLIGAVPDRATWEAQGGNQHGPWWDSWVFSGTTLFALSLYASMCLLSAILPLFAGGGGLIGSLMKRRARYVVAGLCLWAAQWCFAVLQIYYLFWLID